MDTMVHTCSHSNGSPLFIICKNIYEFELINEVRKSSNWLMPHNYKVENILKVYHTILSIESLKFETYISCFILGYSGHYNINYIFHHSVENIYHIKLKNHLRSKSFFVYNVNYSISEVHSIPTVQQSVTHLTTLFNIQLSNVTSILLLGEADNFKNKFILYAKNVILSECEQLTIREMDILLTELTQVYLPIRYTRMNNLIRIFRYIVFTKHKQYNIFDTVLQKYWKTFTWLLTYPNKANSTSIFPGSKFFKTIVHCEDFLSLYDFYRGDNSHRREWSQIKSSNVQQSSIEQSTNITFLMFIDILLPSTGSFASRIKLQIFSAMVLYTCTPPPPFEVLSKPLLLDEKKINAQWCSVIIYNNNIFLIRTITLQQIRINHIYRLATRRGDKNEK
ncbi:hypothetical protein AGLY_009428 [Aphis glycines]|uniref:Uncharacterized protein n=1 Tax=Aphis glycines TaxID=307491 RepID=A0A6G0TJN1_APHGL|nr:hypothetical protein AGLY_009428 [Aphis glycines]